MSFTDGATITVSLIAILISVLSLLIDKRKVMTDIVSRDRVKWISDVRKLMFEFLEKYIKQEKKSKLKIIKSKIDLYIIYDKEAYMAFENKMNYCIQNPYTDNDYRELVQLTQKVLNDVWVRVKTESGITKKDENKILKILKRKK